MKFSQLQKGARLERSAELTGYVAEDGKPVTFLIRALTGAEEADAIRAAFDYARQDGNDKPAEGDALFDMGLMANVIAVACLDPDSPATERTPFFSGGASEILRELSRDTIVHLYNRQALWQDEVSPYRRRLTSEELLAKALEVVAEESDRPFSELSPATQWIFTRTMARLLVGSPEGRSLFTSLSPPAVTGTPSAET